MSTDVSLLQICERVMTLSSSYMFVFSLWNLGKKCGFDHNHQCGNQLLFCLGIENMMMMIMVYDLSGQKSMSQSLRSESNRRAAFRRCLK